MQTMREHVDLRVLPRHDLSVEPERSVALVKRDHFGHEKPRKPGTLPAKDTPASRLLRLKRQPNDVNMTDEKPVKVRLLAAILWQ
jgi:hypothetical protein